MSCELTQIEKICRSIGGINLLQFILPEGLVNPISPTCDLLLEDTLQFLATKFEPTNIYHARDTAVFTEKPNTRNAAGFFYEQALSFEVPKSRLEVCRNIHFLKNRRIHILFRDRNGTVRIMLNAQVQAEVSTRQKRAERNGYVFQASAQSRYKAPYYTGSIINTPDAPYAPNVMGEDTDAWGDPATGEVWSF